MTTSDALDRARESYGRLAWSDAYAQFAAADQESSLEPADLELLATAAYLLGRDDDSAEIWARAYHELLRRGDPARAAWCAGWLAAGLLVRGEQARAGAWVARARGLLDDGERDCVEQGYLLLVAIQHLIEGDAAAACTISDRAAEIGDRYEEPDLSTLARLRWGQALLMLGRTAAGVALLDEVMVAVTAGRRRRCRPRRVLARAKGNREHAAERATLVDDVARGRRQLATALLHRSLLQ